MILKKLSVNNYAPIIEIKNMLKGKMFAFSTTGHISYQSTMIKVEKYWLAIIAGDASYLHKNPAEYIFSDFAIAFAKIIEGYKIIKNLAEKKNTKNLVRSYHDSKSFSKIKNIAIF